MTSERPKLRAHALTDPLHVVMLEPEIPPNTGAIARTCAATGSKLHLIEPLGFRVDEHAVRRAGLDYWHLVDVRLHSNWASFRLAEPTRRLHFFSANASRSYLDADFHPGDGLVFGRESVGLPLTLLDAHRESVCAIPTFAAPHVPGNGAVRSLNVSNAVSIVVYEALRQIGALSNTFFE